jgi:hypothetical protein
MYVIIVLSTDGHKRRALQPLNAKHCASLFSRFSLL